MFGLRGRQIFLLLILAGLIYAASQYVPPYVSAFQFNDFVRQEVKYAATLRKTTDTVRSEISSKASELGIPLDNSDIRITRKGPAFTVDVEYGWLIDMKLYRHRLVFRTSETGEMFDNASD